jgi:hypothetical protein
MIRLSPIHTGVASKSENKGSTYGQANIASNSYSFQRPQRDGGFDNQDRVQVLYVAATLYSSSLRSIIVVNEFSRGPIT